MDKINSINESYINASFEIVKKFKSNGNFDQFRRELFTDMINQVSF